MPVIDHGTKSRPCSPSLAIAAVLAACRPVSPPVTDAPRPARPPALGEPVAVTMIEHQVLYSMPTGFDPTGHIVLSQCSAWREDGVYLGEVPEPQCTRWSDPQVRLSFDGRRSARIDGAVVRLEGEGISGRLACKDCEPVAGVAWSADGTRLALMRQGARDLEIWSVAERSVLRRVSLGEVGRVTAAQLAWPGTLYLLLSETDERPLCEDLEETEGVDCIGGEESSVLRDHPVAYWLSTYDSLDAPPQRERLEVTNEARGPIWMGPFLEYDAVPEAYLDPGGRCLYYMEVDGGTRKTLGERASAEALEGACALDEDHEYEGSGSNLVLLQWVPGPRTQLLSVVNVYTIDEDNDDSYDEGDLGTLEFELLPLEPRGDRELSWSLALEPEEFPDPEQVEGAEVSEVSVTNEQGEARSVGVRADALEVLWTQCYWGTAYASRPTDESEDDEDSDLEKQWCEPSWIDPEGCTILDLAPHRPFELLECEPDRSLFLRGKTEPRIDLEIELRPDDDEPHWVWGEDWLVVTDGATGSTWRSLTAPARARRLGDAKAWVPTTLGPALDRLVLRDERGLRLFDATSGRALSTIPSQLDHAIHAALSPSGRWLAVTDGMQIEAIPLHEGATSKRWRAPETGYLAWRQDEQVLYSGPDPVAPTRAWDVERAIPQPDAVPDVGGEAVDPSWRWALVTPHRVRRLIDGLEIWFDLDGVLLDNGRFEGYPDALYGVVYRLGDEVHRSPVLDPGQVRAVMERKGLAEDFFAGRPIESGPITITAQQRDALVEAAR